VNNMILENNFTVSSEMTDTSGRMRIADLARQMEIITEKQLSFYGMDRDSLKADGKIWVIAWSSIEIKHLPVCGEKITLKVWAGKTKSMMHQRKYGFYTESGVCIVRAASYFILMDALTRKVGGAYAKTDAIAVVQMDQEADAPKMIMRFPESYSSQEKCTVVDQDIDLNGHMNNTRYIDWCERILADAKTFSSVKSVWLQYSKELLLGQSADIAYMLQDGKMYMCASSNGTESFKAVFSY